MIKVVDKDKINIHQPIILNINFYRFSVIVSLIQSRICTLEIFTYTPGLLPQPIPKEVTPSRTLPLVSGPPLSPCKLNNILYPTNIN